MNALSRVLAIPSKQKDVTTDDVASLSQWQILWQRFSRRKLASTALSVLVSLYVLSLLVEFIAPYGPNERHLAYAYAPPQLVRWNLEHGFHVKVLEPQSDPITFRRRFLETADVQPIRLLASGTPVDLLGVFPIRHRLVGIDQARSLRSPPDKATEPTFFLMGADKYGRDVFSRCLYGARISLSIGLVGIALTSFLGVVIGGISGYAGGRTDSVIQRIMEIFQSLPQLPLWIALAAILPDDWSALTVYVAITVLLGLLNWTGLARIVRGKMLALRAEEYAVAARLSGASHTRIIFRHLIPNLSAHVIVSITLGIPAMILGETTLSFLGLGLRPPIISWGVMLQDCAEVKALAFYPWLLMPVAFIIGVVLCFNLVGDGLHDALNPHEHE